MKNEAAADAAAAFFWGTVAAIKLLSTVSVCDMGMDEGWLKGPAGDQKPRLGWLDEWF